MSSAADRDIVITRLFDAPRELVWQAWTDAQHVERWFGPRGFTTRVEELDLRVGGESRYVMVGPDGKEYPGKGVFREIVPMHRIVTTDEFGDPPEDLDLPQGIVLTVVFDEVAPNQTKITMTIAHPTPQDKAKHEAMGVVGGWRSSFECMDEHLAHLAESRMSSTDTEFTATRVYDAPPEVVWKAWTKPEAISRWWGPYGFTTTTHAMDLRPGGVWRFTMHGPDGRDYKNKIVYSIVEPHRRIAYKHADDGDPGTLDPVCFEADIRFEPMEGRTRMHFHMVFPTAEDLRRVVREYGADKGLRETTTRLAEYLGGEIRMTKLE